MPGSPATSTSRPSPASAASRAARAVRSASARPSSVATNAIGPSSPRSSSIRFIGASVSTGRTVPNPAARAASVSRAGPASVPSAELPWDSAFGVQTSVETA